MNPNVLEIQRDDSVPVLNVTIDSGKYTVLQQPDGSVHALRNGEWWRSLTGDNLVLGLAQEVETLRDALNRSDTIAAGRLENILKAGAPRQFPDIGPDPLKDRDVVDNSIEGTEKRLSEACSVQQPGVPDQTALVWRIDLSRVSCETIWRRGQVKALTCALEQAHAITIERLTEIERLKSVLAECKVAIEDDFALYKDHALSLIEMVLNPAFSPPQEQVSNPDGNNDAKPETHPLSEAREPSGVAVGNEAATHPESSSGENQERNPGNSDGDGGLK